jgi:2-hydroxychromene-2-carboxylate isomerase
MADSSAAPTAAPTTAPTDTAIDLGLAHAADSTYDAEFFFDPICPWAWITSRWMAEVVATRGINVHWNFISLKVINEGRTFEGEYAKVVQRSHPRGLRLLRVAAAIRDASGPQAMHGIYTSFGTTIHVDQMADTLDDAAGIIACLKEAGHDKRLAEQADNDAWDTQIRASSALALSRTGKDVGTPIITYAPPDGPALFGPVISAAPKGEAAGELWDHVQYIARNPDFAELKRALRSRPRFD